MGSIGRSAISRIAIIGGGPLGLSTAKYLLAECTFDLIDIYEQHHSVEGTWNHLQPDPQDTTPVPQTNPHQPLEQPVWRGTPFGRRKPHFLTPMYDNLETNIPEPLMVFSDQAFPPKSPLFHSRQAVSAYINEYATDVRHLIKFETQVVEVRLQASVIDSWLVTSKNLCTNEESVATYDAVAICTGHYTVPYIPSSPGIEAWDKKYQGSIAHSKFYRSPRGFGEKKVLVVGYSASGVDIANQISSVSKHPLLISQRSESILSGPGEEETARLKIMSSISAFLDPSHGDRAIEFSDGQVEFGIDVVLFATGYLYSFPFLHDYQLDIVRDGLRVEHVYQHLFHMEHPSLAFIGLPIRITPFPISEVQAAVVARVWSGHLPLPSRAEMADWECATIEENGNGRNFHIMGFPKDVAYQRDMYDWALQAGPEHGKLPVRWTEKHAWIRERFVAIKSAFTKRGEERYTVHEMEQLGFVYEDWRREEDRREEDR